MPGITAIKESTIIGDMPVKHISNVVFTESPTKSPDHWTEKIGYMVIGSKEWYLGKGAEDQLVKCTRSQMWGWLAANTPHPHDVALDVQFVVGALEGLKEGLPRIYLESGYDREVTISMEGEYAGDHTESM